MASQAEARPSALAGMWSEMIGEFFGTMILILYSRSDREHKKG